MIIENIYNILEVYFKVKYIVSSLTNINKSNLVRSTAEAPACPASCRFHAYATTAPSGQTSGICKPQKSFLDRTDSLRTPDSSSSLPIKPKQI